MSTEAKLNQIITELDDGGDIEHSTEKIVKAILTEHLDVAAERLHSPIRDCIRRVRRAAARKLEDEAFAAAKAAAQQATGKPQEPAAGPASQHQAQAPEQPAAASTEPPATEYAPDQLAPYRELRNNTFWVPGHGPVSWGEATEAHHLARAKWLRDHAATLVTSAERHEQAAELIQQHGVEKLGDIDGF